MKALLTIYAVAFLAVPFNSSAVDYQKEILPIFKRQCFKCHGNEEAKGKLNLEEGEIEKHIKSSGEIRPGNAERSALYKSLIEEDEEDRMPQKKEALPAEQIELIKTWIDEGAILAGGDAPKEGEKGEEEEKKPFAESAESSAKPGPVEGSWTNTQGKTIQATLVSVTAKDAILKLSTGKTVPYPIANLAPESQAKVKAFADAMKAAKEKKE